MYKQYGDAVGQAVEQFGSLMLLLVLGGAMWWFGGLMAIGIDNLLSGDNGYMWHRTTLPGIELSVIPLAAVASARLRVGADRILALREIHAGPLLPLLMAASMAGLTAYLVWTWDSPGAIFGSQHEFGPLRWLGVSLLAGFTWLWTPLFPRLTATLAGMVAGPALFAVIGYAFFSSCMPEHLPTGVERSGAADLLIVSSFAMLVWAGGALLMRAVAHNSAEEPAPSHSLRFALWSGLIMLGVSLFGTLYWTAC